MKLTWKLAIVVSLGCGTVGFADVLQLTGYLDPDVPGPSLPAWAWRVAFDLGPPQSFPSEHTNVVLADFLLLASGTLAIESLGYAGTGAGIDPYIALYAGRSYAPATATFVLEHSPGGDFFLTTPLNAGTYVLAISAWNNYGCPFGFAGCTLADGFSGLANLPDGHDTFFDIRITGEVAPVPEPMTAVLLAVPCGFLLRRLARRRTWLRR